jgi:hypothetical protein
MSQTFDIFGPSICEGVGGRRPLYSEESGGSLRNDSGEHYPEVTSA